MHVRRSLMFLAALVTTASAVPPSVGAQLRPESVAKAMIERKASAAEAAATLRDQHKQPPVEVLRILSLVGYGGIDLATVSVGTLRMEPASAAGTLRSLKVSASELATSFASARLSAVVASDAMRAAGFTALQATEAVVGGFRMQPYAAYESLKKGGYLAADLSRAVTDLGIPVDMDCLDAGGMPTPCGDFGQGNNEPVMGQVTWSPQGSALVGEIVTFSSSSIPKVEVLLGAQKLVIVEMTSTRVRAKLPATAGTGDLSFRRVSDGVVGIVETSYEVVAPPPPDPYAGLDWAELADKAFQGAIQDADIWIIGSKFLSASCQVQGPIALASPGVLDGPGLGLTGLVSWNLELAGAPVALSDAWQEAFEGAFLSWADNVSIPGLPFYPTLAAWQGPWAPPTPNVPVPLVSLLSTGALEMTPAALITRLSDQLPGTDAAGAEAAIASFANDLGASFGLFLTNALVMNVLGSGMVPAFAPPSSPAGPVMGGTCSSAGGWTGLLPSGAKVQLPDLGGS